MKIQSCDFNMDTGCVELRYTDETMIAIDCTAVVQSMETSIRSWAELDWLVYNAPLEYAELVLGGDVEAYQKTSQAHIAESGGMNRI